MEEERTVLCIANQKGAAARAHVTESEWTEAAVLRALNEPQRKEDKNPFDLT